MKGTLQQWRMFRGMTRKKLAEAIGRSEPTISNWEKGVSEPTATDIANIEKMLNIKWSDDVIFVPKDLRKK